jgi:hypothetical protein
LARKSRDIKIKALRTVRVNGEALRFHMGRVLAELKRKLSKNRK